VSVAADPIARTTVGAKIFGSFLVMAFVVVALGAYGHLLLDQARQIVNQMYDQPLQAINYGREASVFFLQMDRDVAHRRNETGEDAAALDHQIADLGAQFTGDLDVAEAKAMAENERQMITKIRAGFAEWDQIRKNNGDPTRLDAVAAGIIEDFFLLGEFTAGNADRERHKAVAAVGEFQVRGIWIVAAGLLLAVVTLVLLRRSIVRPLATAAQVANRIAGGELETPIPMARDYETGALLRSMTVMQRNIREMMAREQAEAASAQRRLVDAIESLREGMLLVDADGRVVIANREMAALFPGLGGSLQENTDISVVIEPIRDQLRGHEFGNPSIEQGGEFQLADGRWLRVSRSPTSDGGYFLFLTDITDLITREQRYRDAQKLAEAASEAKSRFLAGMSHELRTPLNAIIGFSEIMAGEYYGPLGSPNYREYAGDILGSGRQLLAVVNDVLELAQTQSGTLTLALEEIDLGEILSDGLGPIRDACAKAGLGFSYKRSEAALPVRADARKLNRAFRNILSNAAKFTKSGGRVTLIAEAAGPGEARVQIIDTGIGMTPEEIEKALAPFGQVDDRLSRQYEGAGLGLPLARALIEHQGGTLLVDSEPGKGTSITVTFPLAV
jgi:signal transduction histidine kinase